MAERRIISKKDSNKSCSELNFQTKTYRTYMSISLRSGSTGLQRLSFLKFYNVLESAKNTYYIKKC